MRRGRPPKSRRRGATIYNPGAAARDIIVGVSSTGRTTYTVTSPRKTQAHTSRDNLSQWAPNLDDDTDLHASGSAPLSGTTHDHSDPDDIPLDYASTTGDDATSGTEDLDLDDDEADVIYLGKRDKAIVRLPPAWLILY